MIHIHRWILCCSFFVEIHTDAWLVGKIDIPIASVIRTSREDFPFLICEFREFLYSEIVDIEIKMHLRSHSDR